MLKITVDNDFLAHFGIKGQKWGVRRFQNEDRTLTELGKKRYGDHGKASAFRTMIDLNNLDSESTVSKERSKMHARKNEYYSYKADERRAKGKTGNFYTKMAQKHKNKIEEDDQRAKEAKDFIKKVIKSATKSGKSITSRNTLIYTGYESGYDKYNQGLAYRVKNDGKGKYKHVPNEVENNATMLIGAYRYYYFK